LDRQSHSFEPCYTVDKNQTSRTTRSPAGRHNAAARIPTFSIFATMTVEIFNTNFTLNLFGFSGTAHNKEYVPTAFQLMERMWKIVKSNGLKNKGLNVWVFEPDDLVFSGVGLTDTPDPTLGLEQKTITLTKYASCKHIGPYSLIKQAGQNMRLELHKMGYEPAMPYLEIYGHMTEDETLLETDLIIALK
jgi:hypothetical protein